MASGGGYPGTRLGAWVREITDGTLEIVRRPAPGAGFQVLPRRWVVERIGLAGAGGLSGAAVEPGLRGAAGYHTAAWIHVAITGLRLRCLARNPSYLNTL